jgi:hypothetical protein
LLSLSAPNLRGYSKPGGVSNNPAVNTKVYSTQFNSTLFCTTFDFIYREYLNLRRRKQKRGLFKIRTSEQLGI